MTDIERMAREAGAAFELGPGDEPTSAGLMFWEEAGGFPSLARFAALVRAQALEDAARHFDKRDAGVGGFYEPNEPAEIIRALAAPAPLPADRAEP